MSEFRLHILLDQSNTIEIEILNADDTAYDLADFEEDGGTMELQMFQERISINEADVPVATKSLENDGLIIFNAENGIVHALFEEYEYDVKQDYQFRLVVKFDESGSNTFIPARGVLKFKLQKLSA